ncbi:MAG: hypothetical protein WD342_12195 [Verrucomicrobiales bacterium]
MTNYFAVLDLPETLGLESSTIENAWQAGARKHHPDGGDEGGETERASELNRARATLADPTSRLEHWLALKNSPPPPDRSISPALMDLFARLNSVLADADAVTSKLKGSSTALAKAMLAKEAVAAQLAVQKMLQEIQSLKDEVTDRFEEFESDAESGSLAEASRGLAQLKFLRKWEQQGQERLLTLLDC